MKKLITLTLVTLTLCVQQNHAMMGNVGRRLTPYAEQLQYQLPQWMRNVGPQYDAFRANLAQRLSRLRNAAPSVGQLATGAAGFGGYGAYQYAQAHPEVLENMRNMTTPGLLTQERRNYLYNMVPDRRTFSNMMPNRDTFSNQYNNVLQNDTVQRTREAINRMYNEAAQSEMANRWRNYWASQGQ